MTERGMEGRKTERDEQTTSMIGPGGVLTCSLSTLYQKYFRCIL